MDAHTTQASNKISGKITSPSMIFEIEKWLNWITRRRLKKWIVDLQVENIIGEEEEDLEDPTELPTKAFYKDANEKVDESHHSKNMKSQKKRRDVNPYSLPNLMKGSREHICGVSVDV